MLEFSYHQRKACISIKRFLSIALLFLSLTVSAPVTVNSGYLSEISDSALSSNLISDAVISVVYNIPPDADINRNPAIYGDQYGATNWKSLSAARNYYGTGYKYFYCGGSVYNYFYCFSDGSRMYFGVH